MKLALGDIVKVVDEDFSGTVIKIDADTVHILCADDFEYQYKIHQLILLKQDGSVEHVVNKKVKIQDPSAVEFKVTETGPRFPLPDFRGQKPSFDLHIEELAPHQFFAFKHDALVYQLDFVRLVIERAIGLKQKNLVFIHGIGAGKLREALRELLKDQYPNIEYFDASYQKFGPGATEILIHGLGKA